MNERLFYVFASVLILASADSAVAQNDVPASVAEVQTAVEKGLFFVEKTAIAWWKKEKCVSCHDGPMLMFSHNIAKRQGFPIDQKKLDFWMDQWILPGGLKSKRKSDGRKDAGGMVLAPITMLFRDLDRDTNPARAANLAKLMQIAGKDWQKDDGSWETSVKFDYRPWIALALESFEKSAMPKDDPIHKAIAERGRRTEVLLQSIERPVSEKSEELAGWLVYEHRRGNKDRKELLLKELLSRQRDDGMWGITIESDHGHYLVTGSVLFALTSIGLDTGHPVVRQAQRILLDGQKDEGYWEEGGRIFDDGSDTLNDVYQCGATAVACAALSQTVKLPAGTKRLFTPDPKLAQAVDKMAANAAKDYDGKAEKSMKKIEMPDSSTEEESTPAPAGTKPVRESPVDQPTPE
jgi:hypothetical protein